MDGLEPDVLGIDATFVELDRLARFGLRIGRRLQMYAPFFVDSTPRLTERLGDGTARTLAVALRGQCVANALVADLAVHPTDERVDLGVRERRRVLAR